LRLAGRGGVSVDEEGPLVRKVVVAGGGVVGWSAAAALARSLPHCEIAVIDPPGAAPSPTDLFSVSTVPSIREFHAMLDIDEDHLIRATGATFKLGTKFIDWGKPGDAYVHSHGEHGAAGAGVAFHQLWLKYRMRGQAGLIGDYAVATEAAGQGRFARPATGAEPGFSSYDYALHVDPTAYAAYLRRYAQARGAKRIERAIVDVRRREADGFIAAIGLADDTSASADLFIDCTGVDARLIGEAPGASFEPWTHWLPCDRALIRRESAQAAPAALTLCTAEASGWRWHVPLAKSSSAGRIYCSTYLSDDEAAGADAGLSRAIRFTSGRRSRPWVGNCLALGDAAISLDPLESTNLHLVQSGLARMIALMPGRDFAAVELAEYNRLAALEAEGVRDFLMLHYVASERGDSPFWRACRTLPVPDSLRYKIDQFRSRGRVVLHDEETFPRDSWLAVLLGQNIVPGRYDPLADAIDEKPALAMLRALRQAVLAAVAGFPTHALALEASNRSARKR
jgi:tryptophan halogenase